VWLICNQSDTIPSSVNVTRLKPLSGSFRYVSVLTLIYFVSVWILWIWKFKSFEPSTLLDFCASFFLGNLFFFLAGVKLSLTFNIWYNPWTFYFIDFLFWCDIYHKTSKPVTCTLFQQWQSVVPKPKLPSIWLVADKCIIALKAFIRLLFYSRLSLLLHLNHLANWFWT
jgi:hypothetical protein